MNPAGSAAQIAVILDDRSYAYFGLNTPVLSELVYSQRQEFGKMGAPFHTYLLQDLLHPEFPAGDYRMIIFLNTIKQPDDIRQAIQKRLQRDQKTLVFIYLQDRYDQHNKIRKDPITGFSVEYREEDEPVQACYKRGHVSANPRILSPFYKEGFYSLGVLERHLDTGSGDAGEARVHQRVQLSAAPSRLVIDGSGDAQRGPPV